MEPTRAKLNELSGGNQHKLVLARALTRKLMVAIVDEPTRGVDVGAIDDVHTMIRGFTDDSVAVVVISPCLPTVLALVGRILVVRQGSVVGVQRQRDNRER